MSNQESRRKKKTPPSVMDQLGLDYLKKKWPDQEKFPLNIDDLGRTVYKTLTDDLLEARDCLIVTGFTSLSKIVDAFGTNKFNNLKSIRILLGNDPILQKRNKYPFNFVEYELREYWIAKGISLYLGSSVLNMIDKLEKNQVTIRFTKKSHAKIYITESHALLGSSNFSKQGLELQQEANIRKGISDDYEDTKRIAENFYSEGQDYNNNLIELLKYLLADVTWQEALGRAIAEVLEGKWFASHNEFFEKLAEKNFWPTQFQGLIEAINILIDKGNVLIADPTGSGKTRMCSATIISFVYWLWQTGRQKLKSNVLLFSPPMVRSNWETELTDLDFLNYKLRSLGILSNATEENLKDILKEISISNVLIIDEAHNLLNPLSNRSRNVSTNNSDFKILITATPVNKKLEDLIRIIELLDIDNLSDDDFNHYKSIKENKLRDVNVQDRERLRSFIDNFLVRRTKAELNAIIDKDPGSYKNRSGKNCRFPRVNNSSYQTKETEGDKLIVKKISSLAEGLKGINYLNKLDPKKHLVKTEDDKRKYVMQRIEGARHLAMYNIRACLRSSKVALLEYLLGTEKINIDYDLNTTKEDSGNVIKTIVDLSTQQPFLGFESNDFPSWITDFNFYQEACKNEISLYNQIKELATELSVSREEGKVGEILNLLATNNIVIAFDSKLITLDFLSKMLKNNANIKSFVATGTNKSTIEKVLRICSAGTTHKDTVIFCSDMMSEGVNLQGASSLILLDLPSVVRLVEQRIGRIDRMDTNHEVIDVMWPNDSEEFSLRGDKRLINTSFFVNSTIGGNYQIPSELMDRHFENVESIEAIQQELEEKRGERGWEGSRNFFRPIELLKEKFVPDDLYQIVRDIKSSIKVRVSFYGSGKNWCFIATKGTLKESPKWILLEPDGNPIFDFIEVSQKLIEYLPLTEGNRLKWRQEILDSYLEVFRGHEKLLLPQKKRRVLELAEYVLKQKLSKEKDPNLKRLLQENIALFRISIKSEMVDFYSLAELWLDVFQPYINRLRDLPRNRRRALNLNNLKDDWKKIDLNENTLQHIIDNCTYAETIDSKIAACIIGVSSSV
jgi:superfamily II DNA or RNA helicase